jgi:hypothetical protein
MDGRRAYENNRADDGFLTKRGTPRGDENAAADSWFKKRLSYVRNEQKKEMRTKLVRVATK